MNRKQSRTKRFIVAAGACAALLAGAAVPPASGGAERSSQTGALAMQAAFAMTSVLWTCPPGSEPATECATREGHADIPGLGMNVTESYLYPIRQDSPGCPVGTFQILRYTVTFTVAGKGTISLAVPGSTEHCLPSALNPTYPPASIEGGSGIYAGASGTVTLDQHAAYSPTGASGTDTWAGTLNVAGLEFDVTPPTFSGAVDKRIRVRKRLRRVRVTYNVTARDGVDGAVPALCLPKSGSRFRIGRTVVRCSATDRSANKQTARFAVIATIRR